MNDNDIESTVNDLLTIVEYINEKAIKLDYSEHVAKLSDSFDYGDEFCFYDENKKLIGLKMDKLYLSCEDGGEDTLCLELYGSDEPAQWFIQIQYGFVTYNDEGNIDDSCDEDTQYATDEVINQLEKIVSDFEEFFMSE